MNLWQRIKESVELRLDEAKESRANARKEREDYKEIERKAYHDELLKVAVKRGAERANKPKGIAGLQDGIKSFSKGLDAIVPPQKKGKSNQPALIDEIVGTKQNKGKTMMDMKFI